MKKKRMIMIGILGITISLLIIGIFLLGKKNNPSLITLSQFQERFNMLSNQDKTIFPLKQYCKQKENERYLCQFSDDFYMNLSYDKDEKIKKVYYYVLNNEEYISKMKQYLPILIETMDDNLSKKKIEEIVETLTDIKNKKADSFGLFVELKKGKNSYIVLEKENGKYLGFFIYQEEL